MTSVIYKQVPYYVYGSGNIGIIVIQVSHVHHRGKIGTTGDEASHLMNSLDWHGAIKDIQNACDYLRNEKKVSKIGVVGFCMGGALTIAAGVHAPVDCGVCFYGIPPKQLADPKDIKVSMQFHFGDKDHSKGFADIAACDALVDDLKASGKNVVQHRIDDKYHPLKHEFTGNTCQFLRYSHADHAFMNEEAPAYPLNMEAAKFGMDASVAFFKHHLTASAES